MNKVNGKELLADVKAKAKTAKTVTVKEARTVKVSSILKTVAAIIVALALIYLGMFIQKSADTTYNNDVQHDVSVYTHSLTRK